MTKNKLRLLKPLSFLPALFMLFVIFSFSSQTGNDSGELSYEITSKIVSTGSNLLHTDLSDQEFHHYVDILHLPVRKAAHMTEYALLALSFYLPYYIYGFRSKKLFALTLLSCVLAASGDEFHQGFVDGRGPSPIDVLIDSTGALAGCFLGVLIHFLCHLKKNR